MKAACLRGCTALLVLLCTFSAWSLAFAQAPPLHPPIRPFVTLPADFRHPESLAVDPASLQIYVGSFDAREPASARRNQILRLSADGKVLASKALGPTPITGLEFHDGHVYFLNFGASKLQRLPADFNADTPVQDIATFAALEPKVPPERRIANPDGSQDVIHFGAAGFPAINGMVFNRNGDVFVSDSFQGAIYRIAAAGRCSPCTVELFARDPLFATTGALPFGANGMAFDADESHLYINNAGDGRVLVMDLPSKQIRVLAESLYGADGLLFHDGWLWVAANQVDAIIALDAQGLQRVRTGRFDGIDAQGAPIGLLFPAATAVQGKRMIIANLALPLTPNPGDEWEEKVTRWNLMQFDLPAGRAR